MYRFSSRCYEWNPAVLQCSYQKILSSLTTAPAERFGESARRGRIVYKKTD